MTFADRVREVYRFLSNANYNYMIIGGVAQGVLGEPRLTQDVDIILFLSEKEVDPFLRSAEKFGFALSHDQSIQSAKDNLSFRMSFNGLPVDCLIACTAFESEALARSFSVSLGGVAVKFPSVEDYILLKLIAGRPKDYLDVSSVAERQKGHIDLGYIKKWVQSFDKNKEVLVYAPRLDRFLKENELAN